MFQSHVLELQKKPIVATIKGGKVFHFLLHPLKFTYLIDEVNRLNGPNTDKSGRKT